MSEIFRNYAVQIKGKEKVDKVENAIYLVQAEMACSRAEAVARLLARGVEKAMEEYRLSMENDSE